MAVNPNSGEVIDLGEAQRYTRGFRNEYPGMDIAFFVGIDKLKLITEQEDCIGVRMYNGYDEVAKVANLVLVGVDSNLKDMTSGVILEKLARCENECDYTSALM